MTLNALIFATKVSREKRIPFEINVDPFYSAENLERLRKSIEQMDSGAVVIKSMEEIKEMVANE